MSADLISIFHKTSCTSGFISHLYQHELQHLYSEAMVPRAVSYRQSPTSYLELPSGDNPETTLSQSLKTKLDNLLNTIRSSQPHFVLCIKPGLAEDYLLDQKLVVTQCRSFNILETFHVMSDGLPHRMRMTTFCVRYGAGGKDRTGEDMGTNCQLVVKRMKEKNLSSSSVINIEWVIGTSHVHFSEGARQVMEEERSSEREEAARRIQRWWTVRRRRRRYTPPCDIDVILQTISLHGLDRVILLVCTFLDYNHFSSRTIPPLPLGRGYTVHQNKKMTFPQLRRLKTPLKDKADMEEVLVIGISPRPAHFLVQKNNNILHISHRNLLPII